MTTGSVRGKCCAPQAGQARCQPPSATSERAPQRAQKRWVACQPRMPLAAAAVPASATVSSAITARRSPKPSASGSAGAGRRRRRGRARAVGRRRSGQSGIVAGESRRAVRDAEEDRRVLRVGEDGMDHRQPGEPGGGAGRDQRLALPECEAERPGVGGQRGVAAQVRRAVERASREGDGLGVSHDVPVRAARPCRKAAAAAIG